MCKNFSFTVEEIEKAISWHALMSRSAASAENYIALPHIASTRVERTYLRLEKIWKSDISDTERDNLGHWPSRSHQDFIKGLGIDYGFFKNCDVESFLAIEKDFASRKNLTKGHEANT